MDEPRRVQRRSRRRGWSLPTRAATLGALPFVRAVDAVLADVAAALAEERAPASLVEPPEPPPGLSPLLPGRLTRVGRQLKTLHDAAARRVEG